MGNRFLIGIYIYIEVDCDVYVVSVNGVRLEANLKFCCINVGVSVWYMTSDRLLPMKSLLSPILHLIGGNVSCVCGVQE